MANRSALVDAYHARLPAPERKALEAIRAAVHAAAPGAEECLFYGMPAVRRGGDPLVGWRAAAKHCAFHPLSGATVAACAAALSGYDTSKGTIRFTAEAPLPAKLVKLLVTTRIGEQAIPTTPKKAAPSRPAPPAKRATGKRAVAKRAVAKRSLAKRPTRPPKGRGA